MKSTMKAFTLSLGLALALSFSSVSWANPGMLTGKVVSILNSGGYTYLEVEGADKKKVWLAAPQTAATVGDQVEAQQGMLMSNFESKSLKRTFEEVYFVASVTVLGKGGSKAAAASTQGQQAAPPHPAAGASQAPQVKAGSIKKAKGGHTISEIFAKRASLGGKQVSVRGKVTKVSSGIMGKTWVHLQDGSGKEGSNDLTVTTVGSAAVGDTVVASGKLAVDKDFGMGYRYDAILEDASLKKE